ncbi:histidinol-phosphate aminotransferase family protein, partial [Candidatus Microgenomates bacterium]|nr:histidinol-phosphate aminotransferase family protein [Candidatus Microgenomates bacterium]
AFSIDAEKIINLADKNKVKIIFLCNPNNPTGTVIPPEIIEEIVKKSKSIVVVDEVYREFYGKSSIPLLQEYDNLVILRSFSKFAAIAGARVGYLISNQFLSQKFDGIRFPMGVSYFSYKLAETVLEKDGNWIKQQVAMIIREREKMANKLTKFGFFVYPSQTNFLLVKVGEQASMLCQKLKKKGFIIRNRSNKKYLAGCVRITVRSPEENNKLLKVIKGVI